MTGTNQLEMKLHEHADRIGKLKQEIKEMQDKLDVTNKVLQTLCDRLHVQG